MNHCLVLVHLVAGTPSAPTPAYVRRDLAMLISEVRVSSDPLLLNARTYIAFDQRGLYVTERPDEVIHAPCVATSPQG